MVNSENGLWSVSRGGAVIAGRVKAATGFWARLRGLLGRSSLGEGEGLWLRGTNGVHTCGMRFPIDVLFLDPNGRVLKVCSRMEPGRVAHAVPGAVSCLELASGVAALSELSPGDQLLFNSANTSELR